MNFKYKGKAFSKIFTSTHNKGDIEIFEGMKNKIMMQKVYNIKFARKYFIDLKPRFKVSNRYLYWVPAILSISYR